MIVGIVGGIGAGKTTVARTFAELGAKLVDADELSHRVLETPAAREAVRQRLGADLVAPDGTVDRAAVARRVFADRTALRRLEEIIHPEVLRAVEESIRTHRRSDRDGQRALVLDVPLLLSTPLRHHCDFLVYVEAPPELRARRTECRGWGPGELERRESFQPSLQEKRGPSDFTINNVGDLDETRRQVEECHARMKELVRGRREDRHRTVGPRSGP